MYADHISIVIRVNVLEYDPSVGKLDTDNDNTAKDSFAHEFKMVSLLSTGWRHSETDAFLQFQNKLAIEELKLLGKDGAAAQSWVSRHLGSLATSMLAKVTAKFSLYASK